MNEGAASTKSAPMQAAAAASLNVNATDVAPAGDGASGPSARTQAEENDPDQDRERSPDSDQLPMSGLRVIDVGTFLAGPYAASILGEFGAEILKVEHPIAGDPMRHFGTASKRHDATLAWLSEGRNKKSVTLDLRQQEGVELFLKLVTKSDVLIENFRPGTMEEWGLGWDELSLSLIHI